jgi:hypothetical protein
MLHMRLILTFLFLCFSWLKCAPGEAYLTELSRFLPPWVKWELRSGPGLQCMYGGIFHFASWRVGVFKLRSNSYLKTAREIVTIRCITNLLQKRLFRNTVIDGNLILGLQPHLQTFTASQTQNIDPSWLEPLILYVVVPWEHKFPASNLEKLRPFPANVAKVSAILSDKIWKDRQSSLGECRPSGDVLSIVFHSYPRLSSRIFCVGRLTPLAICTHILSWQMSALPPLAWTGLIRLTFSVLADSHLIIIHYLLATSILADILTPTELSVKADIILF